MLLSTLPYCEVAEVGAAEPARLSSARNLQPSPCKLSVSVCIANLSVFCGALGPSEPPK